MDYSYNYHQTYLKENKDNTYTGASSSQNPYTVFLNEVLVDYLRELAIYLIKLKRLGITNDQIKEHIIETISIGISNIEYSEEHFFELITKLYDEMVNAKELYINVCKRNDIKVNFVKSNLKNPRKLNFSDLIRQGQKNFNLKYSKLNLNQMSFIELYMNIIKSLCVHLVELRMLGANDEKGYEALLLIFTWKNTHMPDIQKTLPRRINELINIDNQLLRQLHDIKIGKYGEIEPTKVSLTTKPEKAILISGSNLKELELLLEATKDRGINVYTHGNMLLAHSYPKFKTYPHLVGHFGQGAHNYLVDFSDFPGAILLTKNSFLNVEKLFNCKIYTTNPVASKGVGIIKNYNYEPLIESALHSEGFYETTERPDLSINISESHFIEKINEVVQKIKKGEIKHFFVIGVSNQTKAQEDYFKHFLNLLDDTCFALSFSYYNNNKNILHVQSTYDAPFIYKAFDILTQNISIKQLEPIILYTRCELFSFSNLLYMKQLGINKIYFSDCSTSFVNPALITFVRETFDIKEFTTPEKDFRDMVTTIKE